MSPSGHDMRMKRIDEHFEDISLEKLEENLVKAGIGDPRYLSGECPICGPNCDLKGKFKDK